MRRRELEEVGHDRPDEADEYIVELLSFSRAFALAGDTDAHTIVDFAASGADDRAIVAAPRQLETCRRREEYGERFVILRVDERRNYYVQFAVDEGGLFCEVVHNRYLAPKNQFSGDDIATLLALGFMLRTTTAGTSSGCSSPRPLGA